MNTRRNPPRCAAWIAGLCGLAAAAHPALAQHALDRNLQVGSGGVNPAGRNIAEEVRFRNAIVTGNIPGGMSLRADVGYSAPGEMFTRLGSNDLYAFRRDSVYSGLGGLGIRGTDALQYQFAATTGNNPPPIGYGVPTVRRFGTGATAASVQEPPRVAGPLGSDIMTAPRPGTEMDITPGLRSPAAFNSSRDLRPSLLAQVRDEQGVTRLVTASSLRGIAMEQGAAWSTLPGQGAGAVPGLPATGAPTGAPTGDSRTGSERERDGDLAPNPFTPRGTEAQPVDTRIRHRIETGADTRAPYDEVMDRVRRSAMSEVQREIAARGGDPAAQGAGAAPGAAQGGAQDQRADWERRLDDLREELRDPRNPWGQPRDPHAQRPREQPRPDQPPRYELPPQPGATGATGSTGATGPTGAARPPTTLPDATNPARGMSPETIRLLRAARDEVKVLAPSTGMDPYAQAMRIAQDHLAGGRYFDAEERFTSALGARPGDPMAAAGRVNAELGAGMFLSASLNLRSLLVQHPEMAAVKYAQDLMPRPDRVGPLMDRLTELSGEDTPQGRDAGLLLAYMGYQTGGEPALRKGLEAMSRGGCAAPDQMHRLADMLRAVWLEGAPAERRPAGPAP
ncbi:MAG: hypothetical protein WD749_05375, partial [Phycisphaerales bacterium]